MNQFAPRLAEQLAGCAVLPPMPDDQPARRELAAPAAGRADDDPATTTTKPQGKPDRRRTGDRFELLNRFVDFTAGKLTRSELLVWLTLYRDCRDGTSKTAQADLARRTQLGERTVRWALDRLERRGLLVVVHRGGLRRGPSTYRVLPLAKPTG